MLTREEQETAFVGNAAERDTWECTTTDPVWQRRLEALGLEPTETCGLMRRYRLRADQLLVRRGKRAVSDAQRAEAAERMRRMVAARTSPTRDSDA